VIESKAKRNYSKHKENVYIVDSNDEINMKEDSSEFKVIKKKKVLKSHAVEMDTP
jgi:hypothetical protein